MTEESMSKPHVQLEFVEQQQTITDLGALLQISFTNVFVFYLKAHGYHWNVEGEAFNSFHALFGGIAEEVYGNIDTFAEVIRTLDAYTPYTLPLFAKLRTLPDTKLVDASPLPMVRDLLESNALLLDGLTICYKTAESRGELAVANFLQDRIQAHKKHEWFLRATLKSVQ